MLLPEELLRVVVVVERLVFVLLVLVLLVCVALLLRVAEVEVEVAAGLRLWVAVVAGCVPVRLVVVLLVAVEPLLAGTVWRVAGVVVLSCVDRAGC